MKWITLKNEERNKTTRSIVHDWITYKLWAWVYYGLLTVDRNPCSFEHYQIVISPIIVVVSISERFSIECSKANTLSKCNHNHNGQSEEGKIPLWAYETSKYNKLNCLKRGWPSWALHLIGRESGASFLAHFQSEIKQKTNQSRIT